MTTSMISNVIPWKSIRAPVGMLKATKRLSKTTKINAPAIAFPYGTSRKLTYTSSNPSILTVDNVGNVTAKAKGTATITVKTPNGITKSVTITVKERT